jgi:TPR repeat protein
LGLCALAAVCLAERGQAVRAQDEGSMFNGEYGAPWNHPDPEPPDRSFQDRQDEDQQRDMNRMEGASERALGGSDVPETNRSQPEPARNSGGRSEPPAPSQPDHELVSLLSKLDTTPHYPPAKPGPCPEGMTRVFTKMNDAGGSRPGACVGASAVAARYRRACDRGKAFECGQLAVLYARGTGVEQDYGRAVELYQRACQAKEPRACTNLGIAFQLAHGVARDLDRARDLYTQACGAGFGQACTDVAMLYEDGSGVAQDLGLAGAFYKRGCDAGDDTGCVDAGIMIQNHDHDMVRANSIYQSLCDRGAAVGCTYLGLNVARGFGVPRSAVQAVQLYARGCNAGDGRGCHTLGRIYENVAHDARTAASLYQRACDRNFAAGCVKVGFAYEHGTGEPKDLARAISLYKRACDGNAPVGCANLGYLYERGKGVAVDLNLALSYRQQACDGGHTKSCERVTVLKRLSPTPSAPLPRPAIGDGSFSRGSGQ